MTLTKEMREAIGQIISALNEYDKMQAVRRSEMAKATAAIALVRTLIDAPESPEEWKRFGDAQPKDGEYVIACHGESPIICRFDANKNMWFSRPAGYGYGCFINDLWRPLPALPTA